MGTIFDVFGGGSISENEPVAAVAPEDLKSVWAMQDNVQARSPGQQVAIREEFGALARVHRRDFVHPRTSAIRFATS
jgi:hypothetical protein